MTNPMSRSSQTILEMMHERTKGKERHVLFKAVAERIRTGMLDPAEAALIAGWFEKLANGGDPKRTFYGETRGRHKGSTGEKFVNFDYVRLPDHVDLCWNMRRAMRDHGPKSVFKKVSRLYGVTPEYVEEIWDEISPSLDDDPDLLAK